LAAVVATVLAVGAGGLAVVSVRGDSGVHEWAIAAIVPGYVAAGYLLARHRPDVVFGWLFLLAGTLAGLAGLGAAYCGAALAKGWPAAGWAIWVTSWALPLEGLLGAVAVLYFPDGRIESRRWRQAALVAVSLVGVSTLLTMIMPGHFVLLHDTSRPVRALTNPAGVGELASLRGLQRALKETTDVSLTLVSIVIAVRFLGARGLRRRQLRWLALQQATATLYFPPLFLFAPTLFFPALVGTHLLRDGIITFTILRWRRSSVSSGWPWARRGQSCRP